MACSAAAEDELVSTSKIGAIQYRRIAKFFVGFGRLRYQVLLTHVFWKGCSEPFLKDVRGRFNSRMCFVDEF